MGIISTYNLNQYMATNNYIAHAIWKDNEVNVFESGHVIPAEDQIRQGKEVSYEQGGAYGDRGKASIKDKLSSPTGGITRLKDNSPRLSLSKARKYGFISEEQFKKIKEEDLTSIVLNDGKTYPVSAVMRGKKNIITLRMYQA